jgi:hypothetical protein
VPESNRLVFRRSLFDARSNRGWSAWAWDGLEAILGGPGSSGGPYAPGNQYAREGLVEGNVWFNWAPGMTVTEAFPPQGPPFNASNNRSAPDAASVRFRRHLLVPDGTEDYSLDLSSPYAGAGCDIAQLMSRLRGTSAVDPRTGQIYATNPVVLRPAGVNSGE